MRFLAPSFLWLAALAVLPVILYLFRRKSKTVRVSTLVFFKSLAREHREAAWLRRLKKMLSLLLTLLILLGGVAALSRIVFSPDSEDARSVVLLVDRSASMAATSDLGETRLAEAKRRLKARLDALPEAVPVSLVAYDSRPEVVQPKTTNRRAVERELEAL
ncbi:MAG: BatA and WFA domain-containing protein [Verrucomicrobiales bacterium]|nr:BatA and WFA domain-containing protein [Verrucomicrobiales bacterium]